jgi:uroporphyrinogen decarboxylase
MTSSEPRPVDRVLSAVRHQESDRVPRFYRATAGVTQRLTAHFGVSDLNGLLEKLRVDFRFIETPYIGPFMTPDAEGRWTDIWGVPRRTVATATGSYAEAAYYPLADARTPADIRAHRWPETNWFDFTTVREQMKRHANYATMPAGGIACDSPLSILPELRGMEELMIDLVERREMFQAAVGEMMRVRREFLRAFLPHAKGLTFMRVGEDFGSQNGLLFSPRVWDECVRPYFRELVKQAHSHGSLFYLHSCGGIRDLIPRLIAEGVDVLDPVQVRATGMEPAGLKRDFGDRIAFCGGVDLQQLLSRGTPEEVSREVKSLIRIMSPGGGYILGPTHNLQSDVATSNIEAMYVAAD